MLRKKTDHSLHEIQIPCVGYVVSEIDQVGHLDMEYVEPIVKRNLEGLKTAGYRLPMKVIATIKSLKEGEQFTFPDGTVVRQEDAVGPKKKGRKIVICGDTCSARSLEKLGQGANLLIHEATNAYLRGISSESGPKQVESQSRKHGHSTPSVAGEFARKIGAKRLALNHFSSRYLGDQSVESVAIMTRIEQEAIQASGLREDEVVAAWDHMILPVPFPPRNGTVSKDPSE
mmetsp:Transcript_34052/g.52244  ORF Transcript_34052/g.52244 Transcript_34052/m.52244 type:complete len:230 (+) Transcript_34052:1235-1924(+)